jgi:hypothetical protein
VKNRHPYIIRPDTEFNLEPIPVFGTDNRIDFFYQYKRSTENLYLGNIDKKYLSLKRTQSLFNSIESYFINKQYESQDIIDDFSKRLFPKVCWLTDSFLKNGFRYPISVHYNPRLQTNVIHPGSIRNHVIKLFHQEPTVNCLYFNTGGVKFEYINSLKLFNKEDLLKYKDCSYLELVADHTSIIPHINLDPGSVKPNIVKWQEFIYRRLISPTFTISANKRIDILLPWYVRNNANIEITIGNVANEEWIDYACKAVILAVLGRSCETPELTVKHNILFGTPNDVEFDII